MDLQCGKHTQTSKGGTQSIAPARSFLRPHVAKPAIHEFSS